MTTSNDNVGAPASGAMTRVKFTERTMKEKAFVAVLAAASLVSCNGPSTTGDDVARNQGVAPSDTNVAVPEQPQAIPLGRTGAGPGFEFTVKSVEERAAIGSSKRAAADETFVVVRFDFKNTSDAPVSRGERPELTLQDRAGRSFTDDGAAGLGLTGLDDAVDDTNPGMTARITAVWKLDKASFDAGGWHLVLPTEHALRFALR